MPPKCLVLGLLIAATMPTVLATAQAADGLYVPLFTYRTGPFAGSGIPYANGLTDYLTMLNERDGGIGGTKLIIEECETGYDLEHVGDIIDKNLCELAVKKVQAPLSILG
jgi:branched-chain amino acid transport system substrate-binding protein